MPLLFYGTPGKSTTKVLYGVRLQPIETRVFAGYELDKLGPKHKLFAVANYWWFEKRNHTALTWHDPRRIEQTIWMPGLLKQYDATAIARAEFGSVMPGYTVFRINNEHEPYLYE